MKSGPRKVLRYSFDAELELPALETFTPAAARPNGATGDFRMLGRLSYSS